MSENFFKYLKIPIEDIEPSLFECREGSDLTELTLSIEKVGVIEPIIVRQKAKGKYELVGGSRRVSASKCAGLKEIPAIVRELSDEETFVFQVSENLQRVDLTDEEKTKLVVYCAEKYEWKPKEIAQKINMSVDWVYKYLPSQYKDQVKAEAGKVGGEVTREKVLDAVKQTVKTQDTTLEDASLHKVAPKAFERAEFFECERCHIKTSEPKQWHGHTLCTHHFELAEGNPVAYDGWFKMLERGKATTALEPKVTAPTVSLESWKDREARMHPQKSKMEEELLLVLGNDETLRPVVTDRGYPIVTVTPDFVLTRHNLAIFIDGEEVHAHRQDRDDDLRKKLADRHGLKVLSITYSSNTEAEKQRIIKQIKEAI